MTPPLAPTVSVLIPAYNAARYLAAALESVLAQTFGDFELIVIDDGSTDATLAVAQKYAAEDPRVIVLTHPNWGMGRSLNDAMTVARGTWIARLDADDLMLPHRLERQLAFLRNNPDLVVASSTIEYINEYGRSLGQYSSPFTTRQAIEDCVLRHLPVGFHHPAAIFHKQTIQSLGGYRPQFWPADDMDLWNRVIDAGHAVLVQDEVLTQYRIHGGSVTVSKSRSTEHKAQWVQACIVARHEGTAEPTEAEFLDAVRHRPLLQRLDAGRRDWARALYKSAVFSFSRRQYTRFLSGLLMAASLEPVYVIKRVLPQLRRA